MTLRKHNGKTVFGLYTKYALEDNVIECLDELCKMVDKRDEMISNANAELLKRGCRISELEQELEQVSNTRIKLWTRKAFEQCERANEYREELNNMFDERHRLRCDYQNRGEEISRLKHELKCLKAAEDKPDAENTRLWALDKNEMHLKYEKLLERNADLDDHCQLTLKTLNDTNEQFKDYRIHHNDVENAYRICASENAELNAEIKLLKQHAKVIISTSA